MRFLGQYYDSETGLSYNYFRNYDASIERYIEGDPVGVNRDYGDIDFSIDQGSEDDDETEAGLNHVYAYVENNPLGWSDIDGLGRGGSVERRVEHQARTQIIPTSIAGRIQVIQISLFASTIRLARR